MASTAEQSRLDGGRQHDRRLALGPIPLYYQLERDLRTRIESEEFAPGSPLPSEDVLCDGYGVSRITVRRALDGLANQGIIIRRRGVGSFVTERSSGLKTRLTGSLSEFLRSAENMRINAISLAAREAPNEVRTIFGLGPVEYAHLLTAVGTLDEEGPVALLEIWFPTDIGQQLDEDDLNGKVPVVRVIERLLGQRVVRAEQLVEAGRAGSAGQYLQVDPDTPILRVMRTYFNSADRAVEIAFVRYHPQRYRYAIDFRG